MGQGHSSLQDHHLPYAGPSASDHNVAHPFQEIAQGDADDQPPDAAVSSLLAAYLNNPVNPIAAQTPEASAQLAAFGSGEQVKRAVETALQHSARAGEAPDWARRAPLAVEGPFLCMANPDTPPSADRPGASIYGPVDPKLLAATTVVAVYYACYSRNASSPAGRAVDDFDLRSLDPSLGDARLFHSADRPTAEASQALQQARSATNGVSSIAPKASGGLHVIYREVDPYQPPDVDMSSRQRAPRKCGVCGQYYCKGTVL